MISYYLEKGHSLDSLLSLDFLEKSLYIASMQVWAEANNQNNDRK